MLPAPSTRLRFREMTPADLDDMADLLGDPRVMEFYPAPKSRDDAARWIAWNEDNYAAHGFGLWIVETHAGRFVGDCGLTWQKVNGRRELEVGYHVLPTLQGAEPFDLVFIDADKESNTIYLDWAARLGRPGTVIVLDNIGREGEIVDPHTTDPRVAGTRAALEMLGSDDRFDATALQTVGLKGWDGFAVALVTEATGAEAVGA